MWGKKQKLNNGMTHKSMEGLGRKCHWKSIDCGHYLAEEKPDETVATIEIFMELL